MTTEDDRYRINPVFALCQPFNRLNYVFFKYMLASPERKHVTIAFINAVLSHQVAEGEEPVVIQDVEFIDRESIPTHQVDKGTRFDVLVRDTEGRMFHIEVQNERENFFVKRSFFYAMSDYMSQARRGMKYEELRPVIFIGIMDFILPDSSGKPEDWYTLYRITNVRTHKPTFNEVEFHMIEMPLLRRYIEKGKRLPGDKFEEMLCYFGSIGGGKLMMKVVQDNPVVADMIEFERMFTRDPWEVREYLVTERARMDFELSHSLDIEKAAKENKERGIKQGMKQGMKEGIEKGIEKGAEDARLNNARSLRRQGILTDEQIAQALDMPVDVIKNL